MSSTDSIANRIHASSFKKLYWDKLYERSKPESMQPNIPDYVPNFNLIDSKYDPPQGFLVNKNNLELQRSMTSLIPKGYKFSRKATKIVKPREIVQLLKRSKRKICKRIPKTGAIVCKLGN